MLKRICCVTLDSDMITADPQPLSYATGQAFHPSCILGECEPLSRRTDRALFRLFAERGAICSDRRGPFTPLPQWQAPDIHLIRTGQRRGDSTWLATPRTPSWPVPTMASFFPSSAADPSALCNREATRDRETRRREPRAKSARQNQCAECATPVQLNCAPDCRRCACDRLPRTRKRA
jgi:hypothetical protein